MSWLPAQNLIAATRRQLILDFLAEHPGATMRKISAWLIANGDTGNASNTIRTMCDWREARYEGSHGSRRYYPLVTTTRSAEECKAMREANLAATNAPKHKSAGESKDQQTEPGRYVHKPGTCRNPNSGGQGACRPHVYVNCGGNHG